MTDRTKALQTLLANVEAGDIAPSAAWAVFDEAMPSTGFEGISENAMQAYNGSLDAAKALHEAVLTGWEYNLAPTFCHVFPSHDNGDQEASTGNDNNPARAWLIAILKALIAEAYQ